MRVAVHSQIGVESARREARRLASAVGFDADDTERVALAVAELATNLMRYAQSGEIVLNVVEDQTKNHGVQIESSDMGPGIADVERALEEGFSTGGGLGVGLASVRRLVDDFELTSGPEGTRIIARKWATRRR